MLSTPHGVGKVKRETGRSAQLGQSSLCCPRNGHRVARRRASPIPAGLSGTKALDQRFVLMTYRLCGDAHLHEASDHVFSSQPARCRRGGVHICPPMCICTAVTSSKPFRSTDVHNCGHAQPVGRAFGANPGGQHRCQPARTRQHAQCVLCRGAWQAARHRLCQLWRSANRQHDQRSWHQQ